MFDSVIMDKNGTDCSVHVKPYRASPSAGHHAICSDMSERNDKTDPAWQIGNRLRELQKTAGVTDVEVAERLGVSARAWSNYKANRRSPDYAMLLRICQYFDVSPNDLFGMSGGWPLIRRCVKLSAAALNLPLSESQTDALAQVSAAIYETVLDDPTQDPEKIARMATRVVSAGKL